MVFIIASITINALHVDKVARRPTVRYLMGL
jgi:hypothetical protein